MKKVTAIVLAAVFMLVTSVVLMAADKPLRNISAKKHPNLAAAQMLADKAFLRITAAQKANEYDMGGHAAKAKELLEQAGAELKLAAEAANKNNK